MRQGDLAAWNSLISRYANCGRFHDALDVLAEMRRSLIMPNHLTVLISVKSILGVNNAVPQGRALHAYAILTDLIHHTNVGNVFVNMYAKCGNAMDARRLFDQMPSRDIITWNTMIAGYVQNYMDEESLSLFKEMHRFSMVDGVSFSSIFKACRNLAALQEGRQVQALSVKSGYRDELFVGNALIAMYTKCSGIEDAYNSFDEMHNRDAVSWNAMISWHVQQGYFRKALDYFERMRQSGIQADYLILTNILSAAAGAGDIEFGQQNHATIIKTGLQSDVSIANTLVSLYSKCGRMKDAKRVFDNMPLKDVVSWTTLITAAGQKKHAFDATMYFREMLKSGIMPNHITYVSLLNSYDNPEMAIYGKCNHALAEKTGFASNFDVGNSLLTMYSTCASLEVSKRMFEKMPVRAVVSWNALISGFVQKCHFKDALQMFVEMRQHDLKPNDFTFSSVLSACANMLTFSLGTWIHASILKSGFQNNAFVGTALIDMYSKCGSIEDAYLVFSSMTDRSAVTWTAMINAHAQHGLAQEVFELFRQMLNCSIKPDHITFVAILSACSRAGLVDEACQYFNLMEDVYGVEPRVENFTCMVDLFGRAGNLEEAVAFINKMPFEPDISVWQTLLGSCKVYENVEIAKLAAENVLRLQPDNSSAYVLLANISAAANKWDDVAHIRKMMRDRGVKKEPGCSWIDIDNEVHEFVADVSSNSHALNYMHELSG